MHLADTLRSIWRRWYIFLLGLVLSFGLAGAAAVFIQPNYEAEGTLLLMPPTGVVGPEGNPYLYLGGMTEALDVLVRRSNAPESVESVEERFTGLEIVSSPDRTTSSPILIITVTGDNADDVLKAMEVGRTVVLRNLDVMQNELDVPRSMRIGAEDLVIPLEATANRKLALQFAILIAAAGSVGTLMFTGFIDGQLLARAKAKEEAGKQPKPPKGRKRGKRENTVTDEPDGADLFPQDSPAGEPSRGQPTEPAFDRPDRVREGVQS